MKTTTAALVLLLTGCRIILDVPPDCYKERHIVCKGDAFGAHVTHTQYLACEESRATVAVDGWLLEGARYDEGTQITLDEFTLAIANDGRLVVTMGQESVSVRDCTVEGSE
jgi:hypothetical protein